jgi:hypothetical protein
MREVKEQTAAELEQTSVEAAPSNSDETRCPARSLGSDFVVRVAQPLEEDRFNVKIEDIMQYFANLEELEISRISPHDQSWRNWFWSLEIGKAELLQGYRAAVAVQEACFQRNQ